MTIESLIKEAYFKDEPAKAVTPNDLQKIAKVLNISDDTLRKYYDHELETAEALMNAQVAQNLFSIATSKATGCVPAAIFWMKTRAGWRETIKAEVEIKNEPSENLFTFLELVEKAKNG